MTFILLILVQALIAAAVVKLMEGRRGDSAERRRLTQMEERLARLEGSVETLSSEMERIAEGHRFMTRLLTERGEGSSGGRENRPR